MKKDIIPIALSNERYGRALAHTGVMMAVATGNETHGTVCLPNDSLLRTSQNIEELQTFAASYDSMTGNGLARLRDFLIPPRPSTQRIVRLTTYNENEPFETVDYNRVKRGMLADFAEVRQRTATKADLQLPNRGLTVILDREELAGKPEWQQSHTKWLIDILNRASVLEAVDIFTAAAIAYSTVWDAGSNPDLDIRNQVLSLADTTGFYPQNIVYGDRAHLKRQNAYEGQLTAGSLARAAQFTEAELSAALDIPNVLINAERYQSTATAKQEIIGQNALLFTGIKDAGPHDPSNLVRHVQTGGGGTGEYAVYETDIGVKKIALTVENFEYIHTQHTTGIMKIKVN